MNIQPKNYSIEDESKMVKLYTDNPTRDTVQNLAGELGKSAKSITAKLSQLGVYKKIERATKTGKPVISKMDLVKIINEHYNLEMPSLVKATKDDLEKLVTNL
ncbi:MAG: hypothetical protein HN470_05710 [Nitrosomonadales bacterium]|jgi:hypothetical protein|nr:hypothetical protein [Nitrosomonadales bacterium]